MENQPIENLTLDPAFKVMGFDRGPLLQGNKDLCL